MSRPQNPIVRLLEFAGPHKRLTIAGCALSALNAVLAIAMLVCVWFVVRDLVAVAPAWGEARQQLCKRKYRCSIRPSIIGKLASPR